MKLASLAVMSRDKKIGNAGIVGLVENEIVWSPDSRAFFINGNNNGYDDYHTAAHRLDEPELGPGNITAAVEEDMVRSFPPCRAKYALKYCEEEAAHPDFICTAAVDWADGSGRMVIMAEVPCTSYYGGIMCQVLGYEVEASSGQILRRMQANEFAKRWQHSMAWKFNIPEPPEFEE